MANVMREQGVTVVEVDPVYDSLDEWRMSDFRDLVLDAVKKADPPLLLLDLSRTTYIGSSFIGVLIRGWKRLRDRQGRLALCNVCPTCADVLHVSKLDTIWDIYSTRDEARQALLAAPRE